MKGIRFSTISKVSHWLRMLGKTYTTFLSCFSSLLVNSFRISKKRRHGGGADGSSTASMLFCTANNIPARCSAMIASRFFTASKPKDNANLFANSYDRKEKLKQSCNMFIVCLFTCELICHGYILIVYLQINEGLRAFRHIY